MWTKGVYLTESTVFSKNYSIHPMFFHFLENDDTFIKDIPPRFFFAVIFSLFLPNLIKTSLFVTYVKKAGAPIYIKLSFRNLVSS